MTIEKHDEMNVWRCPQLGGSVPFKYCRTMNEGLPCGAIEQCWAGRVDAEAFLIKHYSEDQLKQIFAPRPSRLAVVLETLAKTTKKETEE
jgi:hypothetical protein